MPHEAAQHLSRKARTALDMASLSQTFLLGGRSKGSSKLQLTQAAWLVFDRLKWALAAGQLFLEH